MALSTVKPLLEKADDLLNQSQLRTLDDLMDICALGLGHMAQEADTYCCEISFCSRFVPDFSTELAQMLGMAGFRQKTVR